MIDEFGLYPREEPFDPFRRGCCSRRCRWSRFSFSSRCVGGFRPEAKDGKIDSKAEFIITMDWPDSHP